MTRVDLTRAPSHIPPPQRLDAADSDPKPTYLEIDFHGKIQRYPLEVWRTCNGEVYAVVTETGVGRSLANAQESVVTAIYKTWGIETTVIEYWPTRFADMHYYRVVHAQSGGGGLAPNWSRLDAVGLYLKPPR